MPPRQARGQPLHPIYALTGLEAIINRATLPILGQLDDKPPELIAALLPRLVRVMLAAFLEVMLEQRQAKSP